MNNELFMMQGAPTTEIIYVGPKAIKHDTVSGFKPTMIFNRHKPVPVPLLVAQALLQFDCFIPATDEAIKESKNKDDSLKKHKAMEEEEFERERQVELDRQNTVVNVDDDNIDVNKLTFGEIETLCLANEIKVKRHEGEDKMDLAVRVRKAFEARQAK